MVASVTRQLLKCDSLLFTGFMEKEGKPYCSKDFYQLFAPKCTGCNLPVKENYLTAANGVWHPDCFVCAVSSLVQITAELVNWLYVFM